MAKKLLDITKSEEKWSCSMKFVGSDLDNCEAGAIIRDNCSPAKRGEEGVIIYLKNSEYNQLKNDSNYKID